MGGLSGFFKKVTRAITKPFKKVARAIKKVLSPKIGAAASAPPQRQLTHAQALRQRVGREGSTTRASDDVTLIGEPLGLPGDDGNASLYLGRTYGTAPGQTIGGS